MNFQSGGKLLMIILIVIIIIVVICAYYWTKAGKHKSRGHKDNKNGSNKAIAASTRSPFLTKSSNSLSLGSNSEPSSLSSDTKSPTDELMLSPDLIYTGIKMDPKLQIYRDQIFHTQIQDIVINDDITLDPNYKIVMDGLKTYPRAATKGELTILLKYKKFLDMDGVYSMCGPKEIDQVYLIMLHIIGNKVPGDIVDTGIWKGGVEMMIKAILNHYGEKNRRLWGFDAFDQFPDPQPVILLDEDGNEYKKINDKDALIHNITRMMYSKPPTVYQVRDNFQKFGLLDDNVFLVKGLFEQTIPAANREIQSISLLRLDNDYYDSVLFVLEQLYFKISSKGFVVCDDYNNPAIGCHQAVEDFRHTHNITNKIIDNYNGSVYWQID